jgi:multiple sugar transport system permease protein
VDVSIVQTRRWRPRRRSPRWIVVSVLMWLLGLLFVLPFAWMLVSSLKREIDIFRLPVTWIPHPATLVNYVTVWAGSYPFWHYFLNSLLVSLARVAGDLLTASLAAYGFSRLRFKGRDTLFFIYLSSLTIPFQILLVPRFLLLRQMGLYDTVWALILPGVFTVFGTFLLRQFFMGIPQELSEAARIDGANEFQIYLRVILPLARPALAALAILVFVTSWNDYETPLVMLSTDANYTIPLGLTNFVDVNGGYGAGPTMAGAVSSLLPVFVLFLALQRQFVQAITRTGLKG